MSNTKTPPSLEKVKITSASGKKACLQMTQAGEKLEEALLELEAQAKVSKSVKTNQAK
jgi:hypothetical protein